MAFSVQANLRGKNLFLGVPMYAGGCHGIFCKSMTDLSSLCHKHGVNLKLYYLFNESLITRARNYIADEFMRSDCDHLMFIDSDIGFNPHDVLALMAIQSQENSNFDVIGGPYPKKCISWEKIKVAVDKGFADQDPETLSNFVGDYVFNPKGGTSHIPLQEPVEVLEIGTGFMMIHRRVLEKFNEQFPEYAYRPDHVRTVEFDGSREIMQYFQAEIVNKRYLSEDYWFCQKIQEMHMKTWLCPWMRLQHAGSFIFGGSLIDIAQIGASATADAGQLAEIKERKKNTIEKPKPRKI